MVYAFCAVDFATFVIPSAAPETERPDVVSTEQIPFEEFVASATDSVPDVFTIFVPDDTTPKMEDVAAVRFAARADVSTVAAPTLIVNPAPTVNKPFTALAASATDKTPAVFVMFVPLATLPNADDVAAKDDRSIVTAPDVARSPPPILKTPFTELVEVGKRLVSSSDVSWPAEVINPRELTLKR
jgi:hypothetical protein